MLQRTQSFDPRQEMHLQSYEVFHYRDARPGSVAVHHHDFYEVYLFLEGEAAYSVEGKSYQMRRGDILLVNPMELHQLRVTGAGKPYERYVLWVRPSYLAGLATETTSLTQCFDRSWPNHTNLLRLAPTQWTRALSLLEELVRESYGGEYGSDVAAAGTLLRFMVEINRMALKLRPGAHWEGSGALVDRVLEYINGHYHENLSLDGLAEEFFISKYHLAHEFNRIVGTSVYRYIILKRLVIAKQMLGGGVPPTDVYLNCGFRDYANFYRCFKGEYKISPKQFVDQARQDRLPFV